MKKDNKFSSFLLAVMMIASLFSMVPATACADEMKTVYVGFIDNWHQNGVEELTGWQVHYWGGASGAADADLTRMKGSFAKQSVGDSYWSGEEQTFYMYKATVPADATGYKVHNGNTWVGDDGNLSSCNAAYIFDYGGSNHVLYYSYTEDGYFLVGSMNGWSVGNENYRFTPNTNNEGEYVFYNVSLNKDDEFKVVGVKDNMPTWYPEGFNNNYKVSTTGTYNIYFRPDGQGNDDWYYNYFYVEKITDFSVNDAGTEYTIYTATGWNLFCDMLADNDKGIFTGKTVKLGANIAVSRMAGGSYHDFTGTFDGQGNTLTFEYNATEAYAAPFRYVEGPSATVHAAIQNLNVKSTVTGTNCRHLSGLIGLSGSNVDVSDCNVEVHITSNKGTDDNEMYPSGVMSQCTGPVTISGCTVTGEIATNGKYAAGILGIVQGSATIAKITDCVSSVTINSSTAGDGTHGGFVAVSYPGSTTIEGCLFNGKLLTVGTTDTKNCGGFVGWRTTGAVTISNSLYAPADLDDGETEVVAGTDDNPSATFVRNGSAGTNCYYTRALGTEQGTKVFAVNKGYTENVTPDYATSGIKLHDGYMECDGIWYAPAGTSLKVGYVDEHGDTQSQTATVLGGNTGSDTNYLSSDWYVAGGDISYSAWVRFDNDTQLILADGGKMNVAVSKNDGLTCTDKTLTIYGQTAGTGELHTNSPSASSLRAKSLIVNGGIITANGQFAITINGGNMTVNQGNVTANGQITLNNQSSLTMNGGSLSTPNGKYIWGDASVIFNGGAFNVGIVKVPNVTLNYTSPDDRFKAIIDITTVTVTVADGKAFTDGTNIYSGTLTDDEIFAIRNKTLRPCLLLANADDNSDVIAQGVTLCNGEKQIAVALQGRTLYKDGAWNTLCLPFGVTAAQMAETTHPLYGATIKELDASGTYSGKQTGFDATDGTLYLYFKDATTIEAGKPYIVKWATTGSNIENPVFSGVTVSSTAPTGVTLTDGKYIVSAENSGLNTVQFIGSYSPLALTPDDMSNLFLSTSTKSSNTVSTLYYPSAANNKNGYYYVNAFRGYFHVDLGNATSVRAFQLNFGEDEKTGIVELKNSRIQELKSDTGWYALDGRKLSGKPAKKGMYVYCGKKVVIK